MKLLNIAKDAVKELRTVKQNGTRGSCFVQKSAQIDIMAINGAVLSRSANTRSIRANDTSILSSTQQCAV